MRFYKRLSLYLSMGIMGIGLVTFSVDKPESAVIGSAKEATKEAAAVTDERVGTNLVTLFPSPSPSMPTAIPSEAAAPTTTPQPTATPAPSNDLLKDEYPAVNSLVASFYEAKLECSREKFKPLVTDVSAIDIDKLQLRTEYIKSYENMACYTKWIDGEMDYVVYVTYDMQFPTIESMGSAIDELYVVMDEDDNPVVYLGEISEETVETLSKYRNSEEVVALVEEVNERNTEAIENDESLAEFFKKLQQQ